MRSRTWSTWKTNSADPAASQAGHDHGDRLTRLLKPEAPGNSVTFRDGGHAPAGSENAGPSVCKIARKLISSCKVSDRDYVALGTSLGAIFSHARSPSPHN